MRSCERPLKRSASEALPSSVSNLYCLSIRTHGSSCRRRASSSLRRVSSFSALSSSSRAASHCSRVPVVWLVIALGSLFLSMSLWCGEGSGATYYTNDRSAGPVHCNVRLCDRRVAGLYRLTPLLQKTINDRRDLF